MNTKIKDVDGFDYSKYESKPTWESPCLREREYWGMHERDGRLLLDVERYKFACEDIGITDFIPEPLKKTKEKFFIPAKKEKYDYMINIFNGLLDNFANDWNNEYKPIFDMIEKPSDVYEKNRLGALAFTSDPDDIDEIEIESRFASFRREPKYQQIIQSLYCQFISKLATETDRIMLIVMCKLGYKGKDYKFDALTKFTDGLAGDRNGKKIDQLEKYNAYNMLHKINNFLKHNTISSYEDLKRYYPENVASIEKGTANRPYENGMFAGDWIIIKKGYIDDLIKKLRKFFNDYCVTFVKEKTDEAWWNHDDYFDEAFYWLSDPANFYGV